MTEPLMHPIDSLDSYNNNHAEPLLVQQIPTLKNNSLTPISTPLVVPSTVTDMKIKRQQTPPNNERKKKVITTTTLKTTEENNIETLLQEKILPYKLKELEVLSRYDNNNNGV